MKKVYEVIFDVTGGGHFYIEAENADEAYDIACRQNIKVEDYVEGWEVVPPVEDDAIKDYKSWVSDYEIIREEK